MKPKEIQIIVDTREQNPWLFEEEEKKPGKIKISGSISECLDAADYAIKGYEDLVRIERKMGLRELYGSLINKDGKERFEEEIRKLKVVKFKYIAVESNLTMDILGFSLPQYKGYGPPVSKIVDQLFEYQQSFGVIPVFVGDSGNKFAKNIFRNTAKQWL